jgi:hypothetical protein
VLTASVGDIPSWRRHRWSIDSSTFSDLAAIELAGRKSASARRLAAECLELARQNSDSGVRASLLEMAQKWLDAAELCEHYGWNETLRLRALQAAIGQELRAHYELPQELTHRIFTLLMQLNAPEEGPEQVAQTYVKLVDRIAFHRDQGAVRRGEDHKSN